MMNTEALILELEQVKSELNEWKNEFQNDIETAGKTPSQIHLELVEAKQKETDLLVKIQELTNSEQISLMQQSYKQQEISQLQHSMQDLKQNLTPNIKHLVNTLLDPAVNIQFQKYKDSLAESEKREKTAQDELDAAKFNHESTTGKRIITKLRQLQVENDKYSRQIDEQQKKDVEIALLKEYIEELKKSLGVANEDIEQLDEEVLEMQQLVVSQRQELDSLKTVYNVQ